MDQGHILPFMGQVDGGRHIVFALVQIHSSGVAGRMAHRMLNVGQRHPSMGTRTGKIMSQEMGRDFWFFNSFC